MRSEPEWRELIDGSFGDGPGHRPVVDHVYAGRRALRRRRIATGVVAAVVAVGVGGATWSVLPAEPGSSGPVDSPDWIGRLDSPPVSPDPSGDRALIRWNGSRWVVAPGWTVLDRVNNPLDVELPQRSVAMELRKGERWEFALATYDGPGSGGITHTPVPAETTLEEWLPAQVDNHRELAGEPVAKPVRFGTGETLVPADGVTIVDQVPHPDLPSSFAGADDRSAAALIEVNGKQRYVLVREVHGPAEIIPFTGSFPSLQAFLDYARGQFEGGGGLR